MNRERCDSVFSREGASLDYPESSVILVKDSGDGSGSVDIRRIRNSFDAVVNPEGVLGVSSLSKREARKSEALTGDSSEIASVLSRKIRRMTRT